MKITLAQAAGAVALALDPTVAERRRSPRLQPQLPTDSLVLQTPLWKRTDLVSERKGCDPSRASSDEPDVGILNHQCDPGYSCHELSDEESSNGARGLCVSDQDSGTVQRKLQIENYCNYLEDVYYYDCNCDNCKNERFER